VEERGTALVCPVGGHAVSHFKVLDRLKRTFIDVPVDGDERRGGVMVTTTGPISVAKAPPATPPAAKPHSGELVVLERVKLTDDADNVLWVRLSRVGLRRPVGGVYFAVKWQLLPGGNKAKTSSGTVSAEPAEPAARAAFAAEVARLKKEGWQATPPRRQHGFAAPPKPVLKGKGR
jgi:hypothetical protein